MRLKKEEIKKILFVSLSNIGDAVLTLPALDFIRNNFPEAEITVISGVRPAEIFQNNPFIRKVIPFDKKSTLSRKIAFIRQLNREKFDLVVDLRNSFFGIFLKAKFKTPFFLHTPRHLLHMKEKHLFKVKSLKLKEEKIVLDKTFYIPKEAEARINVLLKENNCSDNDKIIVIAAGAKSHTKRWDKEKFLELIDALYNEFKAKIILVGDKEDAAINSYILGLAKQKVIDFTSKTNLKELACLLKRSSLVITNDSACLHVASYFDVPVLAIFGPTNERKYGPWSNKSIAVTKQIFCRPCELAQCKFGTLKCTEVIQVDDCLRALKELLVEGKVPEKEKNDFKRILVVRTDRIGDVLLSTPVIKALREEFPRAYIAMMVAPYTKEIVEQNPYLDEVIIYDKDSLHKSWLNSYRFSSALKEKKFDLAIVLHPTNRVHLVVFQAGIKRRVGYNRKMGFLLTDKLEHKKQFGLKHEVEYNLDLLRYLGIMPKDNSLFMPLKKESQIWVDVLLRKSGIKVNDKLLGIHPGASCPSKIWPNERFAQVADKISGNFGFKTIIVAGTKDLRLAKEVENKMHTPVLNLSGRTSISQTASLIKRCSIFISNDSGPVHIAQAVGTPVISIFGRDQAGLSPKRWGPYGEKDRILHHPVGCIECLAHNCTKDFKCLKSITVEDVVKAAEEIIKHNI